MKYQAIFFDLDDTLLDSMAARAATLQRVFASAGIPPAGDAAQFLRNLRGTSLEATLVKLAAGLGIGKDLFEDYRYNYWTKKPGLLKLYPGVREMLLELENLGLKLGLVTTKTMNIAYDGVAYGATREMEETGIAELFPVKVGFEDVIQRKPHPEAVHLALSRLQLAPDRVLMVGDSAADVQAGQAAGCRGCHATWGLPPEELADLMGAVKPDFVFDSPDDLIDAVK